MKVVSKKARWAVSALAAVLIGGGLQTSFAQPTAPAAKTEKPAKAPKPKSKTADGTIATASATQVKLTTKEGEVVANLVPATEYWRIQEDVKATDLKTGDTIKFPLRGTNGLPTVQSLAPLTLTFADMATLTLNKTEKMKFDIVTKITATEIAAGQTAKVASNVFEDGRTEAREVWIMIAPVKAAKPAAKPKVAKPKA